MPHSHRHSHSHSHSHSHTANGKLTLAVFINVLLTIVQIVGGILSGSLSLIADALHNLSDAGAIVIAIFARNIATAVLTYMSGAKDSMNLRAAFIHNVSDALASVAVIVAGILIILYQWYVVDIIATILISIYVLYHGGLLALESIKILMQAVPEACDVSAIKADIELNLHITHAHDIHVWQLDEHKLFLECKLELAANIDQVNLAEIKSMLENKYAIKHSTIEVNRQGACIEANCY